MKQKQLEEKRIALGKLFKNQRILLGLKTQKEMAKISGLDREVISKIEHGLNVHVDSLHIYAFHINHEINLIQNEKTNPI